MLVQWVGRGQVHRGREGGMMVRWRRGAEGDCGCTTCSNDDLAGELQRRAAEGEAGGGGSGRVPAQDGGDREVPCTRFNLTPELTLSLLL